MKKKETQDMTSGIKWEKAWDEALARAQSENKPILLDFFNPG